MKQQTARDIHSHYIIHQILHYSTRVEEPGGEGILDIHPPPIQNWKSDENVSTGVCSLPNSVPPTFHLHCGNCEGLLLLALNKHLSNKEECHHS
jgi:hypothetical protein